MPGKRREGLPLVTERRERENSAASRARDGRTGAMDLVGGTSSNPGMPRRVRTPNLRPNHREVRCAEPATAAAAAAAATAASTPTVRDRSGCASTTPGFSGSVASPIPALPLPHLREGETGTRSSFRGASPTFCTTR